MCLMLGLSLPRKILHHGLDFPEFFMNKITGFHAVSVKSNISKMASNNNFPLFNLLPLPLPEGNGFFVRADTSNANKLAK